ncbi:hypothetical protein [Neobacillus sp. LXY-1]|uniref:hypothetical protein n=1 Tax=Neobacillus sp. LXY-1 TaxID=3379133 RepID=UPI003EDFD302
MSKITKQKERWNRIKSKGKKRYVLNTLLMYVVFSLILPTFQVFVVNKIIFPIQWIVTIYLIYLVGWSLLGLWVGNRTWNANTKKFEK